MIYIYMYSGEIVQVSTPVYCHIHARGVTSNCALHRVNLHMRGGVTVMITGNISTAARATVVGGDSRGC
jgi:hypothetical protein